MFLVGIFKWWYGDGLKARVDILIQRLVASADFFSIGLLASTLFSPYRQISATKVSGSVGDQMRAFGDRMVSRTIGAVVRFGMIVIGLITISAQALFGVVVLLVWVMLPALPVFGLVITVVGWVPRWTN